MKKLFTIYVIGISLLPTSCKSEEEQTQTINNTNTSLAVAESLQDEDGNGMLKRGYFEGTVSGWQKDGTAFREDYKFEYQMQTQEKFQNGLLQLFRTDNKLSFCDLSLHASDKRITLDNSRDNEFLFNKVINETELFSIGARPYFDVIKGFDSEISLAANRTYNFYRKPGGALYYSRKIIKFNGAHVDVYTFQNNTEPFYHISYSASDGSLVCLRDEQSDVIVSGDMFDLYNQLVFKFNATLEKNCFYDQSNNALHEVLRDIPADFFEVTNFIHDPATGILSFNYRLIIHPLRAELKGADNFGENTTRHELTITGKFNSGREVLRATKGPRGD